MLFTTIDRYDPPQALSHINLDNRFALIEHIVIIENSRSDDQRVKLSASRYATSVERTSFK